MSSGCAITASAVSQSSGNVSNGSGVVTTRSLVRSYVCSGMANPLLTRGFAVFVAAGFCLLHVQRDGGVEEFEDAALGWGGGGQGGHDGSVGAAVLDVVAGQGGQVVEQGAEGPHRLVGVVFAA